MNILAVGCHPDDLEIGCGGTLSKYAALGHQVTLCHLANGNLGHAVIQPEQLAGIRTREAEEAGRVIGAKEVVNINVNDLEVDSGNRNTVEQVAELIRRVKPGLIITHNPEDYMRDHMETSRIVFSASFSASVPHFETQHPHYPAIVPVFYMDTLAGIGFHPTEYVDISGYMDRKLQALGCHESQIKWMLEHDHIDFLDFIATVSKFRGLQCGKAFAEGFRRCEAWPRLGTERLLP